MQCDSGIVRCLPDRDDEVGDFGEGRDSRGGEAGGDGGGADPAVVSWVV